MQEDELVALASTSDQANEVSFSCLHDSKDQHAEDQLKATEDQQRAIKDQEVAASCSGTWPLGSANQASSYLTSSDSSSHSFDLADPCST